MSKWSTCEKTNIHKNICQHCQGVQEERERILANILAAYPDEEVRTYRSTIITVIESGR